MLAAPILRSGVLPAGFMWLADAAAKLGYTERHARRLCEQVEHLGLAKRIGRKWAISHAVNPDRLGDVETEEGRDFRQIAELAREGYGTEAIQQAEQLRGIVKGFWQFRGASRDQERRAREYINHALTIGTLRPAGIAKLSPRTLRDWCDRYRKGGLRGLVRKAYPEWGSQAFGANARDFFVHVMKSGVTVRSGHDQTLGYILQRKLRDDPDWKLPALRTVQIWWKTRIPEPAKLLISQGPHKMRAACLPKIVRNVRLDYAAGELVIGDERTFDFYVREYGDRGWYRIRPKLTAWRDGVSGMFVGWHVGKSANSDTILSTCEHAALTMKTLPREAYIDNGKDYKAVAGPNRPDRASGCEKSATGGSHQRDRSERKWDHYDAKRIETAFERLGVKVHYARPRHPWSKPIESSFSGLKEFDRFQVSFFGGSPEERPFDVERWSKENIFELPTIDEIRERFAAWLAAYHEEPRRCEATEGLSPRQAFERFYTDRPREITKETLDYLCRKLVGPVKVGQNGVRYQRMRYGAFDEAVWLLQGHEVYFLVDAVDRDSVILCKQDGTPLCVANVDHPLGYKSEEVRDRIAFQRRCEKTIRDYAPSRDYLLKTPAQQIAERRRLAAVSRQIPEEHLPKRPELVSVELVRPDVAAAVDKVKRAAGAEAMRRLAGVDTAAEAMNQPRRISWADLNAATPRDEESEALPVRRVSLAEMTKLMEATSDAP